jgi:hypothetical protein
MEWFENSYVATCRFSKDFLANPEKVSTNGKKKFRSE